jgi:hypothetical protein
LGVSEKPKRSPDWDKGFKHLSGVQRYCSNYIATWSSQAIPVDRIWCDVLFIRSVVAIKSVLVLVHHDAVDDAAIIVRTIFEIEFQLGAIKSDRQIAVRLIQGSEGARLKRLKGFRDSKRPLPEGMTAEEIDRQLEAAGRTGGELKKKFLAEQAKLENVYSTFYSALSDIAHVSPVGLRHYVEELGEVKEGAPRNVRINSSGSLFSPEYVMVLASATQLNILGIIREMRADPVDQELQDLQVENGQIIESVLPKASQREGGPGLLDDPPSPQTSSG